MPHFYVKEKSVLLHKKRKNDFLCIPHFFQIGLRINKCGNKNEFADLLWRKKMKNTWKKITIMMMTGVLAAGMSITANAATKENAGSTTECSENKTESSIGFRIV